MAAGRPADYNGVAGRVTVFSRGTHWPLPGSRLISGPLPLVFAVVIPEGVVAGQAMQVATPDGQSMQVPVPGGYGPGMRVQVQYVALQAAAPAPMALAMSTDSAVALNPVLAGPAAPGLRGVRFNDTLLSDLSETLLGVQPDQFEELLCMVCARDCGFCEVCERVGGRYTFKQPFCRDCGAPMQTEMLPPRFVRLPMAMSD